MRGQPSGVAMANPHDSAATIAFFFTDSDGSDSRHSTFTLGAREQMARFLNEDPFNGGDAVFGTFTFNSNLPVAVIALRGFVNERSEFLMTILPVAPLTATTTDTVYFPHFAAGGGRTTQFILFSGSTGQTASGVIRFTGQDGQPLEFCPWHQRQRQRPPEGSGCSGETTPGKATRPVAQGVNYKRRMLRERLAQWPDAKPWKRKEP